MTTPDSDHLMQMKDHVAALAARLGRWAGEQSDANYRGTPGLEVGSKSSRGDFVTSVDLAVQERIVEDLRDTFPGYGLLGEESGLSDVETDEPVWVIDPIDGTHNFLRNYPGFCVSIGLVHGGQSVLGVIHDSVTDSVSWAVKDGGAWRERAAGTGDAERLNVSTREELGLSLLTTGFTSAASADPGIMRVFGELLRSAAGMRVSGSACRDLSLVAAGRVDVFVQHGIRPWDVAAGAVMVEEAGGRVHLELSGPDLTRSGPLVVYAGVPSIVEQALEIRQRSGASTSGT